MIEVDISTAIFMHLLLSVVVVLIAWSFFSFGTKMKKFNMEEKYIWHCNICDNTYIDSRNEVMSKCPRCKSFLEKPALL